MLLTSQRSALEGKFMRPNFWSDLAIKFTLSVLFVCIFSFGKSDKKYFFASLVLASLPGIGDISSSFIIAYLAGHTSRVADLWLIERRTKITQ